MSLPEAKLYATPEEIQKAWVEWSKYRRCAKCGVAFNWLNSFGAWQCRQHLGSVTKQTVIDDKTGYSKNEWRYWDCCMKRPMTAKRNNNEIVWNNIRTSIPCTDRFPVEIKVEGCIPCDHTEMNNVLDDGIRLGVNLYDVSHSFAPEGGHKVNDCVLYNGEEKIVSQVYFDKSVDLQDVDQGRVSPLLLGWPGMESKISIGDIIDWNVGQDDMPVKVLNWNYHNDASITLDLKIMNLGMPIHEVASMIPHMGPNATDRPGWVFDTDKNGKTIYPHIRNVGNRLNYIGKK